MREHLAALCHDRWSRWMKYLFSKCQPGLPGILEPGCMIIPAEYVTRWMRQAYIPYADLPEDEKDSDRKIADQIIKMQIEEWSKPS